MDPGRGFFGVMYVNNYSETLFVKEIHLIITIVVIYEGITGEGGMKIYVGR